MPDGVTRLWGALLLAFGILFIYGGYNNKKVFGKDGILTKALTTGKLKGVTTGVPALSFHSATKSAQQTVADWTGTAGATAQAIYPNNPTATNPINQAVGY